MPTPPTYTGGQGTGLGSGTTLTAARPAAAVRGSSICVCGIYLENAAVTIAEASSTALGAWREDSSQFALFAKIDDGAGFAFTWGGASAYRDGWNAAYGGVLLDASQIRVAGQANTTASRSMAAPSVTSIYDNSALLFWAGTNGASGGVTPPAGMTERADRAGTYHADLLDMGTAGASGSRSAAMVNSIQSLAALIVLPPADAIPAGRTTRRLNLLGVG